MKLFRWSSKHVNHRLREMGRIQDEYALTASEQATSRFSSRTADESYDEFSAKFVNGIPTSTSSTSLSPFTFDDEQSYAAKTLSASSRPRYLRTLRVWGPELLASFLGLLPILAIVSILLVHQGRAAEASDLPHGLTLNGLLALLGTIQRVFLTVALGSALSQEAWLWLAENATRTNPSSRLRDLSLSDAASRGVWGSLILLFYSWRRWLAFLGAIITVLSLTIDTFTQQLVTYASLPVVDNSSALAPGNLAWTQYYNDFQGNPAEAAFGPSLNVKAAAYNGLLATNITSTQSLCPTGNCTYPLTPSIAVCGDCQATTNQITSCNSTACNYTTATGMVFTMPNWNNTDLGIGFESQSNASAVYESPDNGELTVADFELLGASYGSLSGGLYGTTPAWSSHRCRLWLCVNVYETSMSNGNQIESVIDSYNEVLQSGGVNNTGSNNYTFTLPKQWNKENYTVSYLGWLAISSQLGTMVTGSATLNLEGYSTTSDSLEAVWAGTGDLSSWIQRVALSLTNVVRADNPSTQPRFDGTAFQLGIVVRWWWLVLPISLTVLSLLLLLFVMIGTHRSNIGVWKGSPLTMLLFDVDRPLRQHINDVDWNGFSSGIDSHLSDKKVVLRKLHNGRFLLKGVEDR